MKRGWILACLLPLGFAQAGDYQCGPRKKLRGLQKPVVVKLDKSIRDSPAFYVRIDDRVLFFRPIEVIEAVRATADSLRDPNAPQRAEVQEIFAEALSADMPLVEHTDLFKYSFTHPKLGWAAKEVMDKLLYQGRASIGSWSAFGDKLNPEEDNASFILRTSQFDSFNEEAERWYCTQWGGVLYHQVYKFD